MNRSVIGQSWAKVKDKRLTVKALRVKIGLPEVPPTTHADAAALEEVQKLLKATAFDELIGYDWASGELKE